MVGMGDGVMGFVVKGCGERKLSGNLCKEIARSRRAATRLVGNGNAV